MQSGFGRTGEYFCGDGHFGVVPDILVVAKGIANGFPLSAIASRKELTDLQVCGYHVMARLLVTMAILIQ